MNSEELSPLNPKLLFIKNLPKLLKIILIIFVGVAVVILCLKVRSFLRCSTAGVICEYAFPTMSPERIATQISPLYEAAIQDINAGRLKEARQQLLYIRMLAPQYPGVKEKIAEIEKLFTITPTP